MKDILDFLNKRQRETEHEAIIATFDVVSPYTSIPHDLGLQAIDYVLTNF